MGIERHITPLESRLRELEQRLEATPDDVAVLGAYGEASVLRGRLLEAMKSYQRLVALEPEQDDHRLALSRVYIESGLLGEAWSLLGPLLQASPHLVEGLLLLRRLSIANGSLPIDVSQRLAESDTLLPDRESVGAARMRLEADVRYLDAEIESLLGLIVSSAGDPSVEFSTCLARERQDRLREALAVVTTWEQRHHALDEAERLRRQEEEARQEEERQRREDEEAARRREAEEQARLEAEEAAQRQREAEEQARFEAEEEERRQREAEEAQRGTRAREEAYAALGGQLATVVTGLMKTKGVSAVLVLARDGFLVHETHAHDIDVSVFSEFVLGALAVLAVPGENLGRWKTWVLEFGKGILVLHRVTDDYMLVIHGQTGANFGLLTLFIDKNRGQLESILGGAPVVP